jgi:hypothetical protein
VSVYTGAIFISLGNGLNKTKGKKMTATKVEMRQYVYNTVNTQNLELVGNHSTIATITKEEALQLAQELIACAMDKESDNVRVDFEMRDPSRIGDSPSLHLYFGSSGGVQPKLHWSMVEGHLLYELSEEGLAAN